jgi:hypothetical protein
LNIWNLSLNPSYREGFHLPLSKVHFLPIAFLFGFALLDDAHDVFCDYRPLFGKQKG